MLSTAGVAFLICSVALTGWELLIHHPLANARDRTTLWGGTVDRRPDPATEPPADAALAGGYGGHEHNSGRAIAPLPSQP